MIDVQIDEKIERLMREVSFGNTETQIAMLCNEHITPHRIFRNRMLEFYGKFVALAAGKVNVLKAKKEIRDKTKEIEGLIEAGENPKSLEVQILEAEIEETKTQQLHQKKLIYDAIREQMLNYSIIKQCIEDIDKSGMSFEESEEIYFLHKEEVITKLSKKGIPIFMDPDVSPIGFKLVEKDRDQRKTIDSLSNEFLLLAQSIFSEYDEHHLKFLGE